MIKPTIFLGPPGTGKTTTLLDTVNHEMENGIPPDRIGFMTFTRHGVEEAISRASIRFNLSRGRFRYFNTLHSAAFRQLGIKSDQVFTGKRIQEFGESHGLELHGGLSSDDGTYTHFFGDDLILFFENFARITLQPFETVLQANEVIMAMAMDYDPLRVRRIVKEYKKFKQENNLLDFTDMIELFVAENNPPHLDVLIIDEAQDLSELQWLMVEQLAKHVQRMYVAGDDDQTIFTWAGASERFITLPGDVTVLKQSYRVPNIVHQLANRIIQKIYNRRDKLWLPRDAEGSHTTIEGISQLDPSECDSGQSVMMLGRTVKSLKKYRAYCRGHGILYRYFDATSIRPSFARAITAWMQLQEGKNIPAIEALKIYDLLPGERSTKKPGVAHGHKARIKRLADQEEQVYVSFHELRQDYGLLAEGPWQEVFKEQIDKDIDYIQKVLENGTSLIQTPQVHISTIHRVKGGQANTVVLLSDTAKAAERFGTGNIDEEVRVFYTGITRTYENLVVVQPEKRRYFEGLYE